jgi:LysM repeat protein
MMKRNFVLLILLFTTQIFAQDAKNIDYIRKHALLAVEEMHLYKVPASITLSQGILETGGGQSRLAEIANNHFGIKCKSQKEWSGPTISHTDDAPNECFRKYGSVQESYRDHSKFLAERPYYKDLFKLNLYDYKSWAHGLKKAGYATNPKYAGILISRIEKYRLDEFDRLKPEEVQNKLNELYGHSDIIALSGMAEATSDVMEATIPSPVSTVVAVTMDEPIKQIQKEESPKRIEMEKRPENPMLRIKHHEIGVDYIVANENETIETVAKLYDFHPKELALYNELNSNSKLTPGQFVFLGKKKNKAVQKHYTVQPDDTMYLIAQKVGIRINRLYRLNNLQPGEQAVAGTVLNLKTRKRK